MSMAAEMVVLEQVLSGDPAKDCALKVTQLPLDQQYAAHNSCVILSRRPDEGDPVDAAGSHGVVLVAVFLVAAIVITAAMGWAMQETQGGWDE
ncbi:MAG: hypothetical protein LBJ15_19540 [Comamonas sp.]|jgi:hypothetical protein|uniref:hypothetical protein n=1 Tax=Comamonas sp. TaxID=34028 RepID=UPI002835F256|nr:hypothetical protein [Comamonas sp.]MDR0216169.1 hypothetical protein [Comamonas sp.]